MNLLCPHCKKPVPPEQVNMSTDLAFCPDCQKAFRISEAVLMEEVDPELLKSPPKGCWFEMEMDRIVVGASTRSPAAFFLLPFTLVWAGGSMIGIYGSQIVNREFNLAQSLFGIPFLFGSIFLISITLMSLFGKLEISISHDSCIFLGLGKLGRKRRFDWTSVRAIREERTTGENPGHTLVLEGTERMRFGKELSDKRRNFVRKALISLKSAGASRL